MIPARLLSLAAVLLLAIAQIVPGMAAAAGDTASDMKRHKINIGKLREEIRIHLDKIAQSGKQELSLLEELERIDGKLSAQNAKLTALRERLAAQEQLLALKERDLLQAEQTRENIRQHLEKRLHAFYLMGRTGFLNVSFSSKTLPDLMLFNDSFKQLLSYDQNVITLYRETIASLQRAMAAQEMEKNLLKDFIGQAARENETLTSLQEEKKALLHRVSTQKGLYEQAVHEMQQAEKDLTATVSHLKQKEENRSKGFELSRGRLQPPAQGEIVRHFMQKADDDQSEAELSRGITIAVSKGAPVRAVFEGTVIHAGYMRGYGNMVIIDHGLRYFTITARLDAITVTKGAKVASGELLGTSGDIATLFEKGLYFEIRQDAQSLDPEQWLIPAPAQEAPAQPSAAPAPIPAADPDPAGTSEIPL